MAVKRRPGFHHRPVSVMKVGLTTPCPIALPLPSGAGWPLVERVERVGAGTTDIAERVELVERDSREQH